MIQSLTVTNYVGDSMTIDLRNPEESGFLISSITGLGPAKANVNTSKIATGDGASFNSARLNTRNIVIKAYLLWKPDVETVRQKAYKYFPIKKPVTLKFTLDNRVAMCTGYVESNEPNIFAKQETVQISIICPDPNLYSTDDQTTIFYGIEPSFEFPFSNESYNENKIVMGNIQNKTINVITNKGEGEVGVNIKIHAVGEAGTISIYNTDTRESMTIYDDKIKAKTGSGIIFGDDIDICTELGKKTITLTRNGVETNILNCINKDADWFTLAKGDNLFAFTASKDASLLQFRVVNKIIYEGV